MLPSGIFVRIELDDLISSLPGRLIACGPSRLTVKMEPEDTDLTERSFLKLGYWSDEWCFIEITGPEELTVLVVDSIVGYEPMNEVLSCHFKPEVGEYSYALFREGDAVETFESRGPSIESVNFTSELRKVPLLKILRASDFMIESVKQFGIAPGSRPMAETRSVVFQVTLPGKKTFWQALLGAISSR